MYTRKPKDMTKFLVGITSAQALHTWQYADKTRLSQMGSSAILSSAARKKREIDRKTVGEYSTSQIATIATTMRGDVAKFTQKEHQKREERFQKASPDANPKGIPATPLADRPMPDASLYRRPTI